jgi:hypothetical protein
LLEIPNRLMFPTDDARRKSPDAPGKRTLWNACVRESFGTGPLSLACWQ